MKPHTVKIIGEAQRQRAMEILRGLPLEPVCEVTFREAKSKRSLAQNSIYWKWVDCIRLHVMDSTGQAYSADQMHEWFKAKFLPTSTVEIAGEVQRCRLSTTVLNTAEMSEYMDKIDRFCVSNLGLYLPQPGMMDE